MAQFLSDRSDALGVQFHNNFAPLWESRNKELRRFREEPHTVGAFLDVAAPYAEIAQYLTPEQWRSVGSYIMENGDKAGTLNFFIAVFKLIFGDDAGIEFTVESSAPGVLGIAIEYSDSAIRTRETVNDETRITTDTDTRIAEKVANIITIDNIRGVLSNIVTRGIFVNINISLVT